MRVGMVINYSGGFAETVQELTDFEAAGLEIVFVAEAYSFDAVSQLGFIAARTSTLEIASGILPIYSRTPALTAMTAAGLDYVSGGRFTLGLGTSGPQVIEGWHGVPYDAPIGRTRELIEICRTVWRRDRLDYQGRHYQLPLPAGQVVVEVAPARAHAADVQGENRPREIAHRSRITIGDRQRSVRDDVKRAERRIALRRAGGQRRTPDRRCLLGQVENGLPAFG